MQNKIVLAASLRALIAHLIDYAGMYPPASLSREDAAAKYRAHLQSPESWILNRFVLPTAESLDPGWRVALITDSEPPTRSPQVETFETRQAVKLSLPTYCEVPLDQVPPGAFAKIRTTDLGSEQLADFLLAAAGRRLAFKATAGLHHPVRSSARGMHGFVNVFTAAAFAWRNAPRQLLIDLLDDEDPTAFAFHESVLRWRSHILPVSDIETARRDFAHSFGSCSFDEPIADLNTFGWLS